MKTSFQMPSWKSGLLKRLRRIPFVQIRDGIVLVLFFALLIFMMITPLLFALVTPPTVEFNYW